MERISSKTKQEYGIIEHSEHIKVERLNQEKRLDHLSIRASSQNPYNYSYRPKSILKSAS